jgi:glutamine amidotransferase
MTPDVTIVDTGGANIASLGFAFQRLGASTQITSDGSTIASANRVVLPGVGAAGYAMERLRQAGLISVLRTLTQPVLGICLGLHLLLERSEEQETRCLGIIPASALGLKAAPGRPVPHMGWNEVARLRADPLLEGIPDGSFAYFVHSFAMSVTPHTIATSTYRIGLSAIVRRDNFSGTQFHPERSGKTGSRLLQNFLRL